MTDARRPLAKLMIATALLCSCGPERTGEIVVPAGLDDVRVVAYDVVVQPARSDANTALQTVDIGYYHIGDQRVHHLTDQQVWSYNTATRLWHLSSNVPHFH
jgi:hypothetical protein